MCAKTRLGPRRPPLGHLPEPLLPPFWLLLNSKTEPKLQTNCTKNESIFDQFFNHFWASFGAIFGPQTEPRIHPKTGPEMDQKRAPQGDGPKVVPKTRLCSNLLSLAHSNDHLLKEKPKRGNWVALGCFGLIWAALAYFRLEWAA